jgi:hypothetical protein
VNKLLILFTVAACGDNLGPPLAYHDPKGGKLRLVRDAKSTDQEVVLDLVVGKTALTGFSVGFDLPLDDSRVGFAGFTAGTALDAGPAPIAAMAAMPDSGPLAHMLVAAQSQKATGHATDATLPPGTVLFSVALDLVGGANKGVVFDGTATGFVLPSGGLRDRAGNAVVEPAEVAIGKLEVTR